MGTMEVFYLGAFAALVFAILGALFRPLLRLLLRMTGWNVDIERLRRVEIVSYVVAVAWPILSIGLLVAVFRVIRSDDSSLGSLALLLGPALLAGAVALVAGAVAKIAAHEETPAGKALASELLLDEKVMAFYKATLAAWSSGQLASLGTSFLQQGAMTYKQFLNKYRPKEGNALFVFFSSFPPKPGEFLVGVGDSDHSNGSGWFVLTNTRLVQRDGRNACFKEIALADVEAFKIKGTWTKKMMFKMTSGETTDFEKIEVYPSEQFLGEMIRRARGA